MSEKLTWHPALATLRREHGMTRAYTLFTEHGGFVVFRSKTRIACRPPGRSFFIEVRLRRDEAVDDVARRLAEELQSDE